MTTHDESTLRYKLCDIAYCIYAAGFAAGSDGNVSARLAADRFLVSASGTYLGRLEPDDLVVVDASGKCLDTGRRASSERWMHLAAYAARGDVNAVVHAHPATVVALTIIGAGMPSDVLPEIIIAFGAVPTAQYATPGTPAGADVVKDLVRDHDAIVLDRHGALTLGATADAAFARLEQLEHAARTIAIARQIGGERLATLDADEIARLHELRRAYYGL